MTEHLSLDQIIAQLERQMANVSFVEEGCIRVSDPAFLIECLRRVRDAAAVHEVVAGKLTATGATFQRRVHAWMLACFGEQIAKDAIERNHRFLEEALELVQANGCTVSEAHQLVDYVYGRPQGEINQEAGGVMVTLAALLTAPSIDMGEVAEVELARVWTKVEQIRAKQAAKPRHSPLPAATQAAELPVLKPTHRHEKRGAEYHLEDIGKMQSAKWLTDATIISGGAVGVIERSYADNQPVAIYRSIDDGSWYVRPLEEFEDGRFVAIAEESAK